MKKALLALWIVLVALVVPLRAFAYTPPPMTAHVTDPAGKLTEAQRLAIDRKLEEYRLRTSNEIAVFIPKSLEGESIEDVGIATARAWKLGVKGKDNGVLLVVAPVERRARIEVNRGLEGALTDIQSNDIIREKIRPNLAPGRENYDAAIDAATDAIIADLDADEAGSSGVTRTSGARAPPKPGAGDVLFALVLFGFILAVPILFIVLLVRRFFSSAFSSGGSSASSGWASGSNGPDDSWRGSSWSSDDSWSSGGGGDSGFTGGGSDNFGGGGSSDSF